ncbi:hypothetical protein [Amycolatopsis sp. NPDC052450]|uniref:hypothetical protein n=1 Tax=Amycolatopsis sp. NPDC052450 TaxID=3363937 RepID=UPI0037C7E4EB
MSLRRPSPSAVPLGDPDVLELAREVVGTHYPPELGLFDAVVDEYRRDPDRLLNPETLRAPVGIGVDLVLMTPYILAAAAYLGNILVEKAADKTLDAVRDRLTEAWAARKARRADDDAARPVTSADAELTMVITIHLTGTGAGPEVAREIAGKVSDALLPGKPPHDND